MNHHCETRFISINAVDIYDKIAELWKRDAAIAITLF